MEGGWLDFDLFNPPIFRVIRNSNINQVKAAYKL